MPSVVTTLHQGGTVEGTQARKRRHREIRAFVQAHGPTVIDLFEHGRRAFDDRNFIVHKVSYMAGIYHNYARESFQKFIRILIGGSCTYAYNDLKMSRTNDGP